jgi:DNA-binding response OmpR family regulator
MPRTTTTAVRETTMPQEFTPTERRMLDMLSDGQGHRKEELHTCLSDELSSVETVRVHIHTLRKKLQRSGHDIVCVINKGDAYYRHVITLPKAGDGKR